ncbi:MAG: DNA alkylation repair protein [Chitinophagaceae bacterium]|nr:DNA alkylation repair protein [Chitinophagaceae bacterium]
MSQPLNEIQKILKAKANAEAKAAHKEFVPGKDRIYGVRNPVLNELAQQYKDGGFGLVEELWNAGAYEEKLLAIKMLGKIAKKDPEQSIRIIQIFANDIGNWAICDTLGMQGLRPLLQTHQKEIFSLARKYNQSEDFWQRRLSLVLVEWYTRKKELHPEIKQLVQTLENDSAYYVRKAVVWIKKNFSKEK